jgi:hypothetical protein
VGEGSLVPGAAGEGGDTVPGRDVAAELEAGARTVLCAHWREAQPGGAGGYTVPNASVYPFQWLWDSCFHALVWARLGEDDRAVTELAHLFRTQSPSGFVPHVDYEHAPVHHAEFWGREGHSSITQPPMFGHAVAELHRRGIDVAALLEPARRGLWFLLTERPRVDGLVAMLHPWESGGDDCPRWDDWCPGRWDPQRWYDVKGELVRSLRFSDDASPVRNPGFEVGAASFNALVAFNALELAAVTDDGELAAAARGLVDALDARWDPSVGTWVDAGPSERGSGRVRTLDGLLPTLVSRRREAVDSAFAQIADDRAFGGACGPSQVHREEPAFAARTYWRGPAWPQLSYLTWVAARRQERPDVSDVVARTLRSGALRSGWAEYWDADDGTGLGAAPQSWATVALLVTDP